MSDKQSVNHSLSQSVFKRPEEISSRRQGPDIYDIQAIASISAEETIEDIINNPLKCGYLLAFCESEFSTENINFILEIDRFKDSLRVDKLAWNHSLDYRSVDALLHSENDIITVSPLTMGLSKPIKWSSNMSCRLMKLATTSRRK